MRPAPTHSIAVLKLPDSLRSTFALSLDVPEAANRAARALSQPEPFVPLVLQPGQQLPTPLSVVILPGMGCTTYAEVEHTLASEPGQWAVQTLRAAHAAGVHIATSCAGVFAAAAAGVLDGRSATTSWFLATELAARYPQITVDAECVLVDSGPCLTGGAALAHADVMLAVVERLSGAMLADLCAKYLLLDRRHSQRPYMMLTALIRSDPQLVRAQSWVQQHIAEPFCVADVADAVALGTRTFARRLHKTCGLSPIQFIQRIRIDAARELLAQGHSFETAAAQVGYGDATALRRVFRRHGRPASRASALG